MEGGGSSTSPNPSNGSNPLCSPPLRTLGRQYGTDPVCKHAATQKQTESVYAGVMVASWWRGVYRGIIKACNQVRNQTQDV